MSYLIHNAQKMNDIIFADRNKNYGAYAIRSAYGNTLLKSILIMSTCIASFAITAYLLSEHDDVADPTGQVIPNEIIYSNTLVDITPEKPAAKGVAKPDRPAPKQPDQSRNFTVVDSVATKEVDVSNDKPSNNTTESTTATGTGTETKGKEDGKKEGKGDEGKKEETYELYRVDSQAEFPGGIGALYKFLTDNMRYPAPAFEAGQQGTVFIKFVVDETGKISNLKLLNKAGYGFDEEALRVVSLLPNFKKPAMVNSEPVKVYYQIPIKFKLR